MRLRVMAAAHWLAGWMILMLSQACHGHAPIAEIGGLRVESGYAHPSAGDAAAAYLRFRNTTGSPDSLLQIRGTGFTGAMAMTTTNGHMQALASLSVPAGARVIMAPGGTHLMLEGVSPELRIGDTLHLTLHFAHAGDLAVALPVVPYGEMPE